VKYKIRLVTIPSHLRRPALVVPLPAVTPGRRAGAACGQTSTYRLGDDILLSSSTFRPSSCSTLPVNIWDGMMTPNTLNAHANRRMGALG